MRVQLLGALVVLGAVLAGCVGADDPVDPDVAETDAGAIYSDDRITIETIVKTDIEPPTLASAPKWQLGEFWKVELTDRFVGSSYTTHRVVAGQETNAFLVGMPTHDFSNDFMVLHVPGFGQVMKDDLSFETHDCMFEPLKFPLEVDATWQTKFECRDVTAIVESVEGNMAVVNIIGNNDNIRVVYDAEMRTIVEMDLAGYAVYKVVEHGFDFHEALPSFEGQVTVPHMHDVIFQHGRVGGAANFGGPALGFGADAPFDVVNVDPTYDRVSFVIILGNIWGLVPLPADPPAGGYYSELATAPDGTEYSLTMTPVEPGPLKIATFKHDDPDGDWNFQHMAVGPGLAMAEGIAYHVYDVVLPEGTLLPSVGEHQHGSGEGH